MTISVNSVTGLSQNPVTQATATAGKTALTQKDFLTLLTTQLKNQDPTAPVDNNQLVSQLAQLSTVDGIDRLNTTVSAIGAKLDGAASGTATSNATALIGKSVLVPGNTTGRQADGSVVGAVNVPAAADDVTVTISDMSGATLRTLDLGAQAKGATAFRWDGTDAAGAAVAGTQFKVAARTILHGQSTVATTSVLGRVSGVDLSNAAAPTLLVDGVGPVPVAAVAQIGG